MAKGINFDVKTTVNGRHLNKNGLKNAVVNLSGMKIVQDGGVSLRKRVNNEAKKIASEIVKNIRNNQLSGQKLKTQTGELKNSIKADVSYKESGPQIKVSTTSAYGNMFNDGYKGTQYVKERLEKRDTVFSKKVAPYIRTVRAHARAIDIRALNFIDDEIQRMLPEITERFSRILRSK